jgi:hypothetical protein
MASKRLRSPLRDEISTGDVAVLLRMDPRSVQNAVKAGILQQVRRGVFVLGKTVPAYVQHLRKAISSDPQEVQLKAAKLRKTLADAEKSELELQLFKGQLHTSDSVLFVWSSRIGASRKRLLAMATRLAPHLAGITDQKEIYSRVQAEIETALEDVGELTAKDFVKQDRAYARAHRTNGE